MSARWTESDLADHLAKHPARRSSAPVRHETPPIEGETGKAYRFTVYGKAEPGGSKQAFVPLHPRKMCHCGPIPGKLPYRRPGGGIIVSVVDANKNAKRWSRHVAKTAREEYGGPTFTGPVRVTFIIYRPRPESHYGKAGALNKQGRENPFPITKPDCLKSARILEDSLSLIAWKDDAQIVDEVIQKRYGSPARVEITIEEITVDAAEQIPLIGDVKEAPPPWAQGQEQSID